MVVLLLLAATWLTGAFYFDLPIPKPLRMMVAVLWVGVVLALVGLVRPRKLGFGVIGIVFLGVLGWWLTLAPQQKRDWRPDVARLATSELEGDIVTIHNVRNFFYQSENHYTIRYETRRYHLSNLRGLDLFLTHWGSPAIAHPIFSFDFGPDGRLAFSLETRPENGEDYSAIAGFYRQFELICIAADERDVIGVRARHCKGEEVRLYPLKITPERLRVQLLGYLERMNALALQPSWYNALTDNCTTGIRFQTSSMDKLPWDWRLLANGYIDELLYQYGIIDNALPFAELHERSRINALAQMLEEGDPRFSEVIRSRLPSAPVAPAAPASP